MIHHYQVNNHSTLKTNILNSIANDNKLVYTEKNDVISKTDYDIAGKKDYLDVIVKEFQPTVFKQMCSDYFVKGLVVKHIWYQQYLKNNRHAWHIHPSSMLSLIYFVELDNADNTTEFFDVEKKKVFRPKVVEGDVLVFSSSQIHQSPTMNTTGRKTIVSMNIDLEDVSELIYDYI